MFLGVGPQPASGAGSARFRDRDWIRKFQCQAIGQANALGYQGAAVEDMNPALADALDGHGYGQRVVAGAG